MKIAICDDEPLCIQHLTDAICNLIPCAAVNKYLNGHELLSDNVCSAYDVIFMDISMPGMDGFETAERLRILNDRQILVFVTTLKDQMQQGFKYDAADYLVKPVTYEQLAKLMNRIQKRMNRSRTPDIEIKTTNNKHIHLSPSDIHFLEYKHGHRIKITTSIQTYEYIGKVDEAEKIYAPMGFVRTHRAFVVNMAYMWIIEQDSVTLINGVKVPVSRSRMQPLKEQYRAFRKENSYA